MKMKIPEKIIRKYKNYNPEIFSKDVEMALTLSKIDKYLENKNLDAATEELINTISEIANHHAPLICYKNQKPSTYIPWMTKELSDQIQHKNELLNDFFISRNPLIKKSFDELKNRITSLKRKLKMEWIEQEIIKAGNDPFKLWKLYNYLLNREKQVDCIEPDNIDQDKANSFNNFFCTIGKTTTPTPDLDPTLKPPKNFPKLKFNFQPNSTESIEKLINNLKERTATGYDHIDVRLVKDLKKVISPYLSKLINLGYQINKFPICLKIAIIKPIYKAEDHNLISNYRPIAILPIISKIYERAAIDQMMNFKIANNLLTATQHAYQKYHSTVTCLAEIVNHIYKMLDQKLETAIVKIDLSKAFDTINHQKLIFKLRNLGLDENSLKWIASYLENRAQKTKFKHFTSTQEPINTGVPQGSILGPLLFICYTNDLAENFDEDLCKLFSYADDSTFVVTGKSPLELKSKIKK